MKRLARLAVCGLMLASSTGCCWHNLGGGGCNNGCGYGGFQGGMYGPTGYATSAPMTAGVPMIAPTTAYAPMVAPTTAYAPLNPLPTY